MNSIELADSSRKTILHLGYLFVFLILIDAPLVLLYSLTGSASLAKILLYSSEAIIMLIFVFLLLNSFRMRLPKLIYIYVAYILLTAIVSFLFYDAYDVARDSRRFLALLPPLLLGYYFAWSFGEKRERIVNKIIIFLTIMSVISLIEWIFFYLSYHTMVQLYSEYFQAGPYYFYVKHTSNIHAETGLATSAVTQAGIFIPGFFQFKRATGLYLEGYSAGLNPAFAIILILYSKIARYRTIKSSYIFIIINLIAVILSTSRSAYLLLFVSLLIYLMMKRRLSAALFLSVLPFFYVPFRNFFFSSIKTLGGGAHRDAILQLPDYLSSHILSLEGFIGSGIGSFKDYVDAGAIKDIFIQLGLFGLFMIFLLYFAIMVRIPSSKENIFIVLSVSIAIFLLSIYSGRIFGYKCLGMIHFFLGYITNPFSRLAPHKK